VLATFVVATFEITGPGAVVAKLELPDVVDIPPEFAETTSKSYVVPAVSPVSDTVWLVVSAGFSVDAEPYHFVTP
jgi:hypothetical protein